MSSIAVTPLWDFAIALYAEPGVADYCLQMQDEQGMDVNLLLFAAWLGVSGVSLTDERLEQAIAAGCSWRISVITPLRQARRWIKTEAANRADWQSCRAAIKAAELEAEKVALNQLQSLAENWSGASGNAAHHNIEGYLQAVGLSQQQREAGVDLVQRALCRLLQNSGD
ncbi:MAG TPA: TIGR02444 family protein [Cellvibrionaceae bacterium]